MLETIIKCVHLFFCGESTRKLFPNFCSAINLDMIFQVLIADLIVCVQANCILTIAFDANRSGYY